MRHATLAALALLASTTAFAQQANLPSAIYTDPVADPAHPARMEVLHIPSGTVAIIRANGSTKLQTLHVATDHSWSDKRIALQASIINWLQSLLN